MIGIWGIFREKVLMKEIEKFRISQFPWSRTGVHVLEPHNTLRWFKCIKPERPAHGGEMLPDALHGTVYACCGMRQKKPSKGAL